MNRFYALRKKKFVNKQIKCERQHQHVSLICTFCCCCCCALTIVSFSSSDLTIRILFCFFVFFLFFATITWSSQFPFVITWISNRLVLFDSYTLEWVCVSDHTLEKSYQRWDYSAYGSLLFGQTRRKLVSSVFVSAFEFKKKKTKQWIYKFTMIRLNVCV